MYKTNQEFFDESIAAIVKQGGPSDRIEHNRHGRFVKSYYRHPDNDRVCPSGHWIKPEEYDPRMEGKGLGTIFWQGLLPTRHILYQHFHLAIAVQSAHDAAISWYPEGDFWSRFRNNCRLVAKQYSLNLPQI